jgi:uncharacterized protein YecE (DUF72 family)
VSQALVGCSGWEYREWRGPVYPPDVPRRRWLSWYAERYPTVEVNGTFYGLPAPGSVERWRAAVPETFAFALKLSRFGTHRKHLREPETWLGRFVERVAPLGPSLSVVLVQLPPRWRADPARLDEFLAEAAHHPIPRWAVEVRDPSWLREDVYEVLAARGAALVWHDLLPDHPTVVTAPWLYVRFHGPDALHHAYAGRYPAATLRRWARALRPHLEDGRDVYAYFNNDIGGAAPVDAGVLLGLLARRRRRPQPPG